MGFLNLQRYIIHSSATVGLVVSTGYSFNLDGTNIYMTNSVATVVISRWENEVKPQQLKRNLANPTGTAPPSSVTGRN